jgi:hypothetical protein
MTSHDPQHCRSKMTFGRVEAKVTDFDNSALFGIEQSVCDAD